MAVITRQMWIFTCNFFIEFKICLRYANALYLIESKRMTDTINHKDKKELFLVDGSGYIFRAYHALPPLTSPDGTPIGAVVGFCNMVYKLLITHSEAHIAIVFDSARKNFRNEIYPDYKAHRPPPPEDLIPQFAIIREATKAFGLAGLELDGYEADDLISTYARLAELQSIPVTIVSSDKDLMQLVRDGVKMLDPMKQVSIDVAQVIEKFGVKPDKVADVQALCGDAVDNVPGVPGIGIKTAAQLINEFGSLENLLERLDEIKQPKRRVALECNAELARISKKLVALDDHVPVNHPLESLVPTDPFSESLKAFLDHYGLRALSARIPFLKPDSQHKQHDSPTAPCKLEKEKSQEDSDYQLILKASDLNEWLKEVENTGFLAFDTETNGLTPAIANLVGISLATKEGKACYIPLAHGIKPDLLGLADKAQPSQSKEGDIAAILKPIMCNSSILKVAHNAKFDLQMLEKIGINEVTPLDDTMLMSYVLDGSKHGHGLDELALLYCDHKMISYEEVTGTGKNKISFDQVPIDKACSYAAEDADFTLRLHKILKPRIAVDKVARVYEDVERPLVQVIARMEKNGINVDKDVLRSLSSKFSELINSHEKKIYQLAGHEFNIGSPKQLGKVLFDELGLPGAGKTKTGDWSTSVDILEKLAAQGHEVVAKVLEWRHLSKLKSTYTESLQNQINTHTGRVHTSFAMALTNTGRLSSSDPNLQNIPIRTEEGRLIRTAFVAAEGHVLLSVDYSQIELRLIAEMANIPALKSAFLNGEDIHVRTASEVMGIPIDQVTSELRRQAKAINFGIIYGISGYGLAKQLGCSVGEAANYIKTYMARFPELGQFMEDCKEDARLNGYVLTLMGRKCMIGGIHDKNAAVRGFAERQAINAPLQGTAADLIKLAMVRIDRLIISKNWPIKILLQVHDELIFEVPIEDAPYYAGIITKEMEKVMTLSVPLKVEFGYGHNWADAH